MRIATRKTSIVQAVDLRERRQRANISIERMAESGACGLWPAPQRRRDM